MSPRSVLIGAAIGLIVIVWLTMRARRRAASSDAGPGRGVGGGADFADIDRLMAYGQHEEAARKLLAALAAEPNSEPHIMKLMEVLFVAGNAGAFLDNARFYRKALGEDDWQKVVLMGRQICPDEALFEQSDA